MKDYPLLRQWLYEVQGIVSDYFFYASIAFVLFYVVLKKPLWFRKIQKKLPKLSDYGRDILYSLISVTIFATMAVLCFDYLANYNHLYYKMSDYSWGYYVFTWVFMILVHDAYFYWIHRLMHHPVLFKHVHLVHHKSTNPSPWTAYAFHPLEGFLEALIIPILAFSIPIHIGAVSTFFLFQIAYNVYAHLGFELYPKWLNRTWIGRYIGTSVAHNLHHDKFHGNYGFYFLFWDRLMGTLRTEYDEVFEETTRLRKKQELKEVV